MSNFNLLRQQLVGQCCYRLAALQRRNHHMLSFRLIVLMSSLVSILGFQLTQGYMIKIDAATENECFHERVEKGVKLGFSYEVMDGGFYDVDVHITDPNNVVVHSDEKSSNGKLTFESDLQGAYEFCFGNKLSSRAPKSIIFDIDRSDVVKPKAESTDPAKPDENDETAKLKSMVDNLLLATVSGRHDVRYLVARDKVHRKINEESNSRIVLWSIVEFLLLLGVTLGQVWYLKRFFETRRKA